MSSAEDRSAKLLYILFAILCYFRIYFGICPLDEAQHVGSAFISSMGGKPFFTEMFFQQTAGLLYEPLAAVYYKIFGRSGIYLFARHLFFFLTLFCSWIYFRCCRDQVRFSTAMAIATIPLFATVNGWPTINYHTLGSLSYGVGVLLAVRSVEIRSNRLAFFSGLAFAIGAAAYPTLVGAAVVVWSVIGTIHLWQKRPFAKQFWICTATATVATLSFAGYLLLRFGLANLTESFYFSKTFNTFGSFLNKLAYSGWLLWGFAPPWWLFFPLLVVWYFLWLKKNVPVTTLMAAYLIIVVLKEPPEAGAFSPPAMLIMVTMALFPIGLLFWRQPKKKWGPFALWLTGICTAIIICWTSGLTLYSTCLVTLHMFVPVLLVADSVDSKWWRRFSVLFVPLFMLPIHFKNIPDDDPFFNLTSIVSEGPFMGLFTSPEHLQFYESVQIDINECAQRGKSVLFYDRFPAGFLMTDMIPATRSLFMHEINLSWFVRPWYRAYYSDPKNRPDCVFRFKKSSISGGVIYDHDPQKFAPAQDVFWNYLPEETGEYRILRERDFYNVYLKSALF